MTLRFFRYSCGLSGLIIAMSLPPAGLLGLDQISIGADFGEVHQLLDADQATPLDGGNRSVDGDGFVFQLGYYSGASVAGNFNGEWIPLTGEGSGNSEHGNTTVGDYLDGSWASDEEGDGHILASHFSLFSDSPNLPQSGQVLAIRFYNGADLVSSTHYGAISSDDWIFTSPGTPPSFPLSLSDRDSVEWEGGLIAFTGIEISAQNPPMSPFAGDPGWKLTFIGWVNDSFYPWLYHDKHSCLFAEPFAEVEDGLWLFDINPEMSWLFTNAALHPNYFSIGLQSWLFFFEDTSRVFFDFTLNDFRNVGRSGE